MLASPMEGSDSLYFSLANPHPGIFLEWERSIDDDGVEVALLGGGEGGLGELNVVVLVGGLGWGFGFWHSLLDRFLGHCGILK